MPGRKVYRDDGRLTRRWEVRPVSNLYAFRDNAITGNITWRGSRMSHNVYPDTA